jgi:hypothetical protein
MLRADGHATGFFALHAHDGCGMCIFFPSPDFNPRTSRIKFFFVKERAGQLTGMAVRAMFRCYYQNAHGMPRFGSFPFWTV